jgi:hypothetical protein
MDLLATSLQRGTELMEMKIQRSVRGNMKLKKVAKSEA